MNRYKLVKSGGFLLFLSLIILSSGYYSLKNNDQCFDVNQIGLPEIPNSKQIGYISRIKPNTFGLVDTISSVEWINDVNMLEVFGYDFSKFYGSRSFSSLMKLEPSSIDNIDIIGYCPWDEDIDTEEFTKMVRILNEKFPNQKMLLAPCIRLYEWVDKTDNIPDFLGFALFERDFDAYLNGKYDHLIFDTLKHRDSVDIYIALRPNADLEKLKEVLNRATSQNLNIGFGFHGTDRIFEFILENRCKQAK